MEGDNREAVPFFCIQHLHRGFSLHLWLYTSIPERMGFLAHTFVVKVRLLAKKYE